MFVSGVCRETSPTKEGAWAFIVIRDGKEIAREYAAIKPTSGPRMELTAIRKAQEWIEQNVSDDDLITINSANQCAVLTIKKYYPDRMRNGTTAKLSNIDCIEPVMENIRRSKKKTTYVWCGGKSRCGNSMRAAEIANRVM